jgi:D-3-phosphoglycerate dehydrogenase
MKILVACNLPDETLGELRNLAVDLDVQPDALPETLRKRIKDVGILIVGDQRISGALIASADSLQLIVHAGEGPGQIATDAASEHGVFVSHCPDTHATARAELVMGLLIALDRQVVENAQAIHAGKWMRGDFGQSRGLLGNTLGIVGFGAVGRLVADRARAFGMLVRVWSPQLTTTIEPDADIELCNWPRELARESDFVAVLTTLEDEGQTLVDGEFVRNLKEGARLVHVGDSWALDEVAIAEAVEQRGLRLALDVFNSEPTAETSRFRCRLCELPGVIGTQHQGPLTEQARTAIGQAVVRIVRAFIITGDAEHCINIAEDSPAKWQLVLRMRDQVGVMASILEAVRADGINAEEITSRVFTGARAAWCTIALDERPSTEALESIRGLPDVLHLELRAVV